jgi:hypothetical protein
LAQQGQDVEAAADQFSECDPAVLRDGGEADMDFAILVFGTDIERRSLFRQRAEPVFARDVGNVLMQLYD